MTGNLDIESVMRALTHTLELEKATTPKGVFLKRLVDGLESARHVCDLVIHRKDVGIKFHPSGNWGVGLSKSGERRVFYPVVWTGDSGDQLKCWYRII